MWIDGLRKARLGQTTLEQVARAVPITLDEARSSGDNLGDDVTGVRAAA